MIAISGTTAGAPFQDQGTGSRDGRFGGTLNVDVTGTSIQFKLGSVIDAVTNGSWAPLPNGSQGNAPADFGAQASLFGGLTTAKAALRNVVVDATSAVIPIQGTSFNSSGMVFQFPVGGTASLDYLVSGLVKTNGSKLLESLGTNDVTTTGSLITKGSTQTLTVPVKATFTFELASPNDTIVILTGKLVASRDVSQPVVFDAGSVAVNALNVTLQWQAPANQTFRIQGSSNLTIWNDRATNITSGSTSYSWNGTRIGPNEFFRLVQ
jgi:hypothetical protein